MNTTKVLVAGLLVLADRLLFEEFAAHPKYQPIAHIRQNHHVWNPLQWPEDVGAVVLCCDQRSA